MKSNKLPVYPSLKIKIDDNESIYNTKCALYCHGYDIEWSEFLNSHRTNFEHISLPKYAFQGRHLNVRGPLVNLHVFSKCPHNLLGQKQIGTLNVNFTLFLLFFIYE